ncbi:MAG: hypothetical protein EOR43_27790 [Mesorhizobium sp.]|uniref:hypothetical protein n=1 Tax=Mesorhizobium sp. TaxID=1871066 RepID=UPI000FE42AB6|nr:hypothetical protein [Mesorhizobium sp.]RWJ97339.1 MAG: hypothetical protein EOR42_28795 [Mesorhizobium sp.]RWK08232.1 MAG: hypothetical protein EOR39_20270 [Mesorhizobium sp.]RWK17572.1 MAG: hypothetical protein EOR43_27790 [Mesorhizobium sp.]RWK27066.1 MAG: hypothetical protein EOR44_29120 [Mesorhizobium sp.]TIQ42236.1 MAG: hypothetical protein E5X47_32095 [Mesorhizobium sp.]
MALYDAVLGDEIGLGTHTDIEIAAGQGLDKARADDRTILAAATFIASDRIMVAGIPAVSDKERKDEPHVRKIPVQAEKGRRLRSSGIARKQIILAIA